MFLVPAFRENQKYKKKLKHQDKVLPIFISRNNYPDGT